MGDTATGYGHSTFPPGNSLSNELKLEEPTWWRAADCARDIRVSSGFIRREIREGRLEAREICGQIRVHRDTWRAYLAERNLPRTPKAWGGGDAS